MYYQNYEDYMRAVLGYPVDSSIYQRNDSYFMEQMPNYINEKQIEEMYPQIYKTLNPLVCSACDGLSGEITNQMLENMVDEIYKKVELNNEIMVRINIENRDIEKTEKISKTNNIQNRTNEPTIANRSFEQEDRQARRNPLLQDLIRILILNRILGGFPPNRPPRPPFPGPRPPHGGPGGRPPFPPPGVRPPRPRTMMSNEYNDDYTNF